MTTENRLTCETSGGRQPTLDESRATEAQAVAEAVLDELETAVLGQRQALGDVLVAVLMGGHVLIEDLPGLGKTLIARSFARVLGLEFGRVQFTPDLLPSDLTGAGVYNPHTGDIVFRPGPIFTNVLLADEINRTPPKTQAALLEAMGERQVTVDGVTYQLPTPFVVLATDNPIEHEGTYPLPEAQLDRFALRLSLGYPSQQHEAELIRRRILRGREDVELGQVADVSILARLQDDVESIYVEPDVVDYVTRLLAATRAHSDVVMGASPRAGLMLVQASRARALLEGRTFVLVDDVKHLAVPVLAHRLALKPELWVRRVDEAAVLRQIVSQVSTPPTVPK